MLLELNNCNTTCNDKIQASQGIICYRLDDFTSRIHYWSCNLLHLCRLSFYSQVFVMDVEVYIVELCCLLLFLVRKDLLWLHFIPGINVISFKSLILSISETEYTKF